MRKHVDFEVPGFAELEHAPAARASYASRIMQLEPEGYWRLGETEGQTAYDASGHAHHGIYTGGVTLGQPGALYRDADGSVKIDGLTGYIQTTFAGILGANPFSVLTWAKFDSTFQEAHNFVGWGNDSLNGGKWHFRTNPTSHHGTLGAARAEVQGGYIVSATPLLDDQWHCIAYTFAGTDVTDVQIYVDGELEQITGQQARAVDIQPGVLPLMLGARRQGTLEHLKGLLDEVAVFPAALASDQIRMLYHRGIGRFDQSDSQLDQHA